MLVGLLLFVLLFPLVPFVCWVLASRLAAPRPDGNAARPEAGLAVLYEDSTILCDEEGLTIHRYYFPGGAGKRLRWSDVRSFEERPLTLWTGKYKLWGGGDVWLSEDGRRMDKERLFILDTGGLVKPGLTPDRPEEFLEVLEAKVGAGSRG